jgi:hypothetical protein
MANAKHTPGPWEFFQEPDKDAGEQEFLEVHTGECGTDNFRPIAHVVGTGDNFEITAQDYENAHLITAAPDLLEALKNLDWLQEGGCSYEAWDIAWEKARVAIAKAKGK